MPHYLLVAYILSARPATASNKVSRKEKRVFAIVESEAHFVKVGLQMLCANTMPRSHDAALQERECGFYGVRVDVAVDVDAILVVDRLVLCEYSGLMQGLWVAVNSSVIITSTSCEMFSRMYFASVPDFTSSAWKKRSAPPR